MPAVKISQLPAGTAPAGSELLPAVQGATTVALTVNQMRAGLAAAAHTHALAEVGGLQTALDAKLAQGKHTIWMPAAAMTPRTTNGAASGMVETASAKVMRRTLDFDPSTPEYSQFTVAMPKSWNKGMVSFQALWTAASGSGGVVWALQAVAMGDGDGTDAAFGAAALVTDALVAAGALHVTAESGAVTIAGSPAEGDLVVFQLARVAGDASDTLAVDATLLGVRLFYTVSAGNDA